MRWIEVKKGDFVLKEEVEVVFEKRVTPFGNSAKVDVPKRYTGWRAYVIIVRDWGDFVPKPSYAIYFYMCPRFLISV